MWDLALLAPSYVDPPIRTTRFFHECETSGWNVVKSVTAELAVLAEKRESRFDIPAK
jgi:hypothetical protein